MEMCVGYDFVELFTPSLSAALFNENRKILKIIIFFMCLVRHHKTVIECHQKMFYKKKRRRRRKTLE